MTVEYDQVAGWLTLLVLVSGFILFLRGGGGVALAHLRDANDVLTKTIEVQEGKIKDQASKLQEAEREISELRGRTDISIAIAQALGPLVEWSGSHELRAQERHERTMIVLDLIAARLGPEPNNKEI